MISNELQVERIKKSTDLKLRNSAEVRINMIGEGIRPLMQKWNRASPTEKIAIEAELAKMGEKIINIYVVNSRSQ